MDGYEVVEYKISHLRVFGASRKDFVLRINSAMIPMSNIILSSFFSYCDP